MWKGESILNVQKLYWWMSQFQVHVVTMREIHPTIGFGQMCESMVGCDLVSNCDMHSSKLFIVNYCV